MNCSRCNTPLTPNARFCPNCGLALQSTGQRTTQAVPPGTPWIPTTQPPFENQPATTVPPGTWQPFPDSYARPGGQPISTIQPGQPVREQGMFNLQEKDTPPQFPSLSSSPTATPLSNYQQQIPIGAKMPPATINTLKPRRSRMGCVLGCLSTLIILLLVTGAVWLFVVRPSVHNLAQNQLDRAMSEAVQRIPPEAAVLPPGPLNVQENTFNNLIVLNLAPSDPIQNVATTISPNGVRIDFQIYGQSCAVSSIPKVIGGKITATNVTVEGIISLIMSPDELTTLLNKHLQDAQTRLKHSIIDVQSKDHVLTILLGPPQAILPG